MATDHGVSKSQARLGMHTEAQHASRHDANWFLAKMRGAEDRVRPHGREEIPSPPGPLLILSHLPAFFTSPHTLW